MNKKNANFEKFCKQLIEHKILISKQRRATCPEIRVIWSYSFEYDEKVIRSFNEPSRNFEFCQPQCLKCVCAFLVELDPAGLICCHFTSALPDIGKKIAKQSHKVPVFEII